VNLEVNMTLENSCYVKMLYLCVNFFKFMTTWEVINLKNFLCYLKYT